MSRVSTYSFNQGKRSESLCLILSYLAVLRRKARSQAGGAGISSADLDAQSVRLSSPARRVGVIGIRIRRIRGRTEERERFWDSHVGKGFLFFFEVRDTRGGETLPPGLD